MRKPKKEQFVEHGAVMLHPQSCDSSIRYVVEAYKRDGKRAFDTRVILSDCNRQITWAGYGETGGQEMEEKLNEAIRVLAEVRKVVRRARLHYGALAPASRVKK